MKKLSVEEIESIAEDMGCEVLGTYNDGNGVYVFEDDGLLHVVRGRKRLAIDVSNGQRFTAKQQNELTRKLLKKLNIPFSRRVLAR